MKHYSPLPLSILAACVGGVVIAALILMTGGGVVFAFAGYSLGGAVVLVMTACLLTLGAWARDRSGLGQEPALAEGA